MRVSATELLPTLPIDHPAAVDLSAVERVRDSNFVGTLVVALSSGWGSLARNGDPNWSFAAAK